MSQLFGFALAENEEVRHTFPMPITVITVAPPQVGNKTWLHEFQRLEKIGCLRHIRVTNDGDQVCVTPFLGYYQTGLNIHLYPKRKAAIEYSKQWSRLSMVKFVGFEITHAVSTYLELLKSDENRDILKKSVEDLYEEAIYGKYL